MLRVSTLFAAAVLALTALGAGAAQTASAHPTKATSSVKAAFMWAANAWGECNTKRPWAAEASNIWFGGLSTWGHPNNWYGTQCKYWVQYEAEGFGSYIVPVYQSVNWYRACSLDAAGMRWHLYFRAPDGTYWCVLG